MRELRVVFINPSVDKYSDMKLWGSKFVKNLLGKQNINLLPKLSAMVLAAVTTQEFEFIYVDEEVEDIEFDKLSPDLVAITSMTVQANRAYEIADEFKRMGVTVVMGGIHPTVMPDEALQHCDSVLIGEGENTWQAMLKDFKNKCLKKIYNSMEYPEVTEFPIPKYEILKHDRYLLNPIQATRGCPYDCDFCSVKSSSGKKYKMKPVEQVIKEIEYAETFNKGLFKKGYFFVDDNLYVNREYTKSLFKEMSKLKITWMGQGTVNIAKDKEIIELMAKSGCRNFSIGFESLSQDSLEEANKPKINDVQEYKNAIDIIQSYGITAAGTFIFGFDQDGPKVFEKTVNFAKEANIYTPFFNILTPFPGTRFFDRLEAEGRIIDKDWSKYNALRSVIKPNKMSPEVLQEGAYWATSEVSTIEILEKQLKRFWEKGPWESNPKLSIMERMILLGVGMKAWKRKDFRDFLFRCAISKNAVDANNILTGIFVSSAAEQIPPSRNPLEFLEK